MSKPDRIVRPVSFNVGEAIAPDEALVVLLTLEHEDGEVIGYGLVADDAIRIANVVIARAEDQAKRRDSS